MSERKLLISQKKQIKPLSREERFLSAAVGGDYETAPLNAKEQIMKNVVDNGGGGITPTGTINITENGEHDVMSYATASVNVTSDFGTAEVTIVNGSASHVVSGTLPVTQSFESVDFAAGEFAVPSGETSTFSAITYKGKCILNLFYSTDYNIVTSGAVEYDGEGQCIITGNCTLTVSDNPITD